MKRRLFIAILLPEEFKNRLLEAPKFFTGLPEPARWIKAENLHLTVLFLGWIKEEFVSVIKNLPLLTIVSNGRFFDLRMEKIILAPPERRPRMVWAQFQKSSELENLKNQLYQEIKCSGLKIQEEKRISRPHITLCRFREASRKIFEYFPEIEINVRLPVKSIALMESRLYRSGAEYQLLAEYHLTQR